jgi:hypothetical protein
MDAMAVWHALWAFKPHKNICWFAESVERNGVTLYFHAHAPIITIDLMSSKLVLRFHEEGAFRDKAYTWERKPTPTEMVKLRLIL